MSRNDSFDLSFEYRYYQGIASKMERCCKLGRNIDANEAYYYMHLPYVKSFKDACILCIKDNKRCIIFFQKVKSWFYKHLKRNKKVVLTVSFMKEFIKGFVIKLLHIVILNSLAMLIAIIGWYVGSLEFCF